MTRLRRLVLGQRVVALTAGVFLLQAIWVLAVPPFRASDEFDHAYRAAGVARGEWRLTETSSQGRGLLVDVPPRIVAAASAQCTDLRYTEPANCHPVHVNADGTVQVTTAAGTYNPLYYWVVGQASLVLDGVAALYGMRVVSMLLCLAFIAAAVAITWSQRPGRWERLGLLVSMTPALVFSSAMAAPNGLEMCAGLTLWTAGLALVRARRPDLARRYLLAAGASAVILTFVRTLGPFWILLTVGVLAVYAGRSGLSRVWRDHGRGVSLVTAGTVAGVGWAAWWFLVSDGGQSSDGLGAKIVDPVYFYSAQSVLSVLQIVGAFPYRDQLAPAAAYVLFLLVVAVGVLAALVRAAPRPRAAVWLAVLLTLTVPTLLTVLTASSQGYVWQGRYELPFVVGVMLLVGAALDEAGWAPKAGPALAAAALLMLGAAWVLCIHRVVAAELVRPASIDGSGWVHPPLWVMDGLTALAFGFTASVVWARASRGDRVGPSGPPREVEPWRPGPGVSVDS